MPAIKIKCKGSAMLPLDDLQIIQGDLKELSEANYAKLRARIEKYGFDAPIFVWRKKVLDGTQRLRVLLKMVEDGWTLPAGKVPVCQITAANENEAKERLLGYVSQFGKLTHEGLYEFSHDIPGLDYEGLDLPDFNMGEFMDGYVLDGQEGENEGESGSEKPEVKFTEELLEAQNYLVFTFDNGVDWNTVVAQLGIESAAALDSREGYERKGIGRMISGEVLLRILGVG